MTAPATSALGTTRLRVTRRHEILVRRRHVDLRRVSSAACPGR